MNSSVHIPRITRISQTGPQLRRWKRFLFFLLMLLMLASCGRWGWESIETDNEEQLNIFGIISLDDSLESFIVVHKTLDTAGPDELIAGRDTVYFDTWEWYDEDAGMMVRDTFWYDQPWVRTLYESRYLVKDASVTVSDGTQTYAFERAPLPGYHGEYFYYNDILRDPAIYRNTDGSFAPRPETEYTLLITTPEGMEVTGSLTTPPLPEIKEASLADTISVRDRYSIEWNYAGDYAVIVGTDYASQEIYDWICGLEQWSALDAGDSTWVSDYPSWCLDEGWEVDPNLTNDMLIRVSLLDDNYYQYFLAPGDAATISNLLLGEGGIAAAYGLEGGFGVFGAVSASWTHRIAKP